jgi:hypothetical protein
LTFWDWDSVRFKGNELSSPVFGAVPFWGLNRWTARAIFKLIDNINKILIMDFAI